MSGCLDDCTCRSCCCGCCCDSLCDKLEEIDWSMKRNALASVAAGCLFFVGWWLAIDMAAVSHTNNAYFAIGVGSTIAFFMINAVSASQLDNDAYQQGCLSGNLARLWLFVGFLFAFSALIGCSGVLYIEVARHAHAPVPVNTTTTMAPVTVNGTVNATTAPPLLATTHLTGSTVPPTNSTVMPTTMPPTQFERLWPGVAIFLQNFLIFTATMVFKFTRTEELY